MSFSSTGQLPELASKVTRSEWMLKDTFIAIIMVVLGGISFVPMKIDLQYLTPFELGAWRFLFTAIPLCFVIKLPKVRWR